METIRKIEASNKLSADELLLFIDNNENCYNEKLRLFETRETSKNEINAKNEFAKIALNFDFTQFLLYYDKQYSLIVLNEPAVKNNPVFNKRIREEVKVKLIDQYFEYLKERAKK